MHKDDNDNNKDTKQNPSEKITESNSEAGDIPANSEAISHESDGDNNRGELSPEEKAARLAKLEEEIRQTAESLTDSNPSKPIEEHAHNNEEQVDANDEIIDESAIDDAVEEAQRRQQAVLAAHRKSVQEEEQQLGELSLEEKPDTKQDKLTCMNCHTVLTGPYCHECGQPDRHFIRFFPKVLWEMINEAFDLDSKIFRTIMPLFFRPGSLTLEYIAGRRARYVNPLRLYIITSILFFISISVFTNIEDEMANTDTNQGVKSRTLVSDDESDADPASAKDPNSQGGLIQFDLSGVETNDEQKRFEEAVKALEELKKKKADGSPIPDFAINKLEEALADGKLEESELSSLKLSSEDMKVTLSDGKEWHPVDNPMSFDNHFSPEITQSLNNYLWELKNKAEVANEDPKEFVEEIFNLIPQLMFIVLPVFALLLKVMYIFKKRYYMEHLIVALHSHSFIFMSGITILILSFLHDRYEHISWFESTSSLLMFAVGAWIPINLLLQQKRVYAQGKFMTFIKFVFVGISYQILLSITALAAMILGLIAL